MNVGDVTFRLGGERREEILQSVYDGSFFRDMTALMLTKDKERREAEKKAAAEDALMALTDPRKDQQKSALDQLRELRIDKLQGDDGREIPAELLLVLRAASTVTKARTAEELTEGQDEDRERIDGIQDREGKDRQARKIQNDLLDLAVYGTIRSGGSGGEDRGEPENEGKEVNV